MPQSLAGVYLHTVFSTKNRTPSLRDHALSDRLHAYMAGICTNLDCPAIHIGGWDDHVHLLHRFGREITISHFLMVLKKESSKWMKRPGQDVADFKWQAGYGSFSISAGHVEAVKGYVDSDHQAAHHQEISFQEEFRILCQKYGFEIDERYVWD